MIPQIEPLFGTEEANAVSEYIQSGAWLTEHTKARELENQIAEFLRIGNCTMVPNGTLALWAALCCLGIGTGDRVLVPAYTMIATANAVRMAGADVVLADIDPDTLCIDLSDDGRFENIGALIAVDLNGRASNLWTAVGLACKYGFRFIEDAAQAFGSTYDESPLGTIADAGCFSFSPHKIISMGQGGCVVTDQPELAAKLRRFKNFGRAGQGGHDHTTYGVNLKFTDLQAVIGLEQMNRLPARIDKKRETFALYRDRLDGVDEVSFIPTDLDDVTPWYVDVLVEDKESLMAYLRARGIGTQSFYPAIHKTGAYSSYSSQSFPVAECVSNRGLWLPSSVTLTDSDIKHVCDCIKNFYTRSKR